jgi:putative ABC transport system permease protein
MTELRHALRSLLRQPVTTFWVVVTLALGIAANLALFAYVAIFLAQRFPAPEPERIVRFEPRVGPGDEMRLSYADWQAYAAEQRSFSAFGAARLTGLAVEVPAGPRFAWSWLVSGDYFALLEQRPHRGRWLMPADDQPGAPRVLVVSHRFWQRHLGGAPDALGSTLLLEGRHAYTIVGITPADFLADGFPQSLYLPLAHWPELVTGATASSLMLRQAHGRLAPGVELEQARAEAAALAAGLDANDPLEDARKPLLTLTTEPAPGFVEDPYSVRAQVMLGVVALFLLLAAANAANLTLARALGRRREVAIQTALGASRGQLLRGLAAEAVWVAAAAGLLGGLLGQAGIAVLDRLLRVMPVGLGEWADNISALTIDRRGLAFGVGIALLATLLAYLSPAVLLLRGGLVGALRGAGGSARGGWLRPGLVVVQVALSVMLVASGLLLASSLLRLTSEDPGFAVDDLLLASFYAAGGGDPARPREAYREVVEATRALPGVAGAAVIARPPLFGGAFEDTVRLGPTPEPVETLSNVAGPGYLGALGVGLVEGRDLAETDRVGGERVALVNRSFVERHFPGGALGRSFELTSGPVAEQGSYRIVGVFADHRFQDLESKIRPLALFSVAQRPRQRLTLVVRTAPEAAGALLGPLRDRLARASAGLPLIELVPMREQLRRALAEPRLNLGVSVGVGILGLLLAGIGLFGVLSQTVARRRREIGIRLALGARRRDASGLIVAETTRLVGVGLVLGLAGTLALGRALESLLYQAEAHDPAVLTLVVALLGAVALLATAQPARKAASVEPATVLREE